MPHEYTIRMLHSYRMKKYGMTHAQESMSDKKCGMTLK
jgi:hypothetical protein